MIHMHYADFAWEQTAALLAIDSPSGYTMAAAKWVKNAFEAAGGKIMTSSVFGKGIKYIVTMPAVADNGRILESNSSEFLLNRYSELFVQLCDSCQLPMLG